MMKRKGLKFIELPFLAPLYTLHSTLCVNKETLPQFHAASLSNAFYSAFPPMRQAAAVAVAVAKLVDT